MNNSNPQCRVLMSVLRARSRLVNGVAGTRSCVTTTVSGIVLGISIAGAFHENEPDTVWEPRSSLQKLRAAWQYA